MKDNSTNTTEKMTTEEFHRLLEENTMRQAEARTLHQATLAKIQNDYTQAIDSIIEQENDALDDYRKARQAFEEAKDIYDSKTRQFSKMRNCAGLIYNQAKVKESNAWTLSNNKLQSDRHNIFDRFRDSGGQIVGDMAELLHPSWSKREKRVSDN